MSSVREIFAYALDKTRTNKKKTFSIGKKKTSENKTNFIWSYRDAYLVAGIKEKYSVPRKAAAAVVFKNGLYGGRRAHNATVTGSIFSGSASARPSNFLAKALDPQPYWTHNWGGNNGCPEKVTMTSLIQNR